MPRIKAKALQLTSGWVSEGDGYEFDLDRDAEGRDFGSVSSSSGQYHRGILKQRFSAHPYWGKRIKLVGYCRCENVSWYGGIFVRTEKLNGRPITSDDIANRCLVGTSDWLRYELVIDVPPEAINIAIGAYLRGTGKVWFKDLQIEEVTRAVPTTDQYALGCVDFWDLEPVNLCFTEDELPQLREGRPYISEARRWVISWELDGPAYEFVRPKKVLFEGKPTALLRPVDQPDCGYLYQHFAAARYRGKRVRYSLYLKTKRASSGASLMADMYDADSNDLMSVMKENPVIGTNDWTLRELEFDVPIEAYAISIGAVLQGPGEVYIGGLKFEIVD